MRKKILLFSFVLFSGLFCYSQDPWGHRYSAEQPNQNISVDINTNFTVSVEWNQGDWTASDFGYGYSTDGSGWTWVDCPWFQNGDANNKRCRKTDMSISTPGKYYYAFRFIKNNTTTYQHGSDGWSLNATTLNASSTIMVGDVSKAGGSWSSTDTWEDGTVPNSSSNVAIMHNVSISSAGQTNSIYIYSGKTLTIEDNGSFTVSSSINNNGTFTIQSNTDGTGSLITNGTVTGNISCERYIAAYPDATHGWHLLSSPVAAFDINGSDYDPGTVSPNIDDLYAWDEVTGYWLNHKSGIPSQIVPGTGYFAAYQSTSTKSVTGVLNNSDITKTNLSFTTASTNTGWHLLGNPFPCALLWNATSWSLSNVSGTAKIWNENSASYSDISQNGIIPANQGFMVYVTSATNSITIPKADRTHSSQAWYKDTELNKLILTVEDPEGNTSQQSIIKFNENATQGFDTEFDSYFLSGFAPMFYSSIDGKAASTNALPELSDEVSVPLYFIKNDASVFNLKVEGLETLEIETPVLVTDSKTNQTINFREVDSYSFVSEEGDSPSRFTLHFKSTGIADNQNLLQPLFYYQPYHLTIKNLQPGSYQITVSDITGRRVAAKKVTTDGSVEMPLLLQTGVYIVEVSSETMRVANKIIIK